MFTTPVYFADVRAIGTKYSNPTIQDTATTASRDENEVDSLTLEDIVDSEMFALLPFSLDDDALLASQE